QQLEPEVQLAAVRYLAELGALEVRATLRRLARHDDAEVRLTAADAARSFQAERDRDAGERFLTALGEPDRAVRALLARRLRTLPIASVLEQADVLLSEDAAGVVQILGELRQPEVTHYLLALVDRPELPALVGARAIGAIEADQAWERAALGTLAHRADADESIRAAAVQAMGAFATSVELLDRIGDLARSPSAPIRGAVLWAVQLAARADDRSDAPALAALVEPMLDDADPVVRRRAAYVAGNLGLEALAPALARRCDADDPPDLRLAAYIALGELRMPGVLTEVVAAVRREEDPRILGAATNALVASSPSPAAVASLAARATKLLTAPDRRSREAGLEIAGLLAGAIPTSALAPLAHDEAPAVRGATMWALGRLADPASEPTLLGAFRDPDVMVHERAAAGLLVMGTPAALAQAITYAAGDGDATARAELAATITIPRSHAEALAPVIDRALAAIDGDDPAFEPLLQLKLKALQSRASESSAPPVDVDGEITAMFPAFTQLAKLAGFDALIRSLRTAESLFQSTGSSPDADQSPPITLWMKVLENYVHAWLGPRLANLQRDPATLFDYVDRVIGSSWAPYQRWLEPMWKDPIEVGTARVEIPLRSIPNAVRELQEHRRKRLDSPLSVTEWARMIVLFAVDHPSGFKNLFKLADPAAQAKGAKKTVALAHRLHMLAAVRNLVTHRANAGAATLA
ncbi:MAG: HEAT repeat domain-containing protein, partial [Proteobacteria bacterium]|nr:HEAT repeat domain-containing protein [Pseudomonadota bacterium]